MRTHYRGEDGRTLCNLATGAVRVVTRYATCVNCIRKHAVISLPLLVTKHVEYDDRGGACDRCGGYIDRAYADNTRCLTCGKQFYTRVKIAPIPIANIPAALRATTWRPNMRREEVRL